MIKGANRRIVIMKDTGSDYFEQAFFLVKENQLKNKKEPAGKNSVNPTRIIPAINLVIARKNSLKLISFLRRILLFYRRHAAHVWEMRSDNIDL